MNVDLSIYVEYVILRNVINYPESVPSFNTRIPDYT